MPLLLAQSRKMLIAFTTIALLMFSILMLTVDDHDDVSFGTKASVLHTTSAEHDVAATNTEHENF